MIDRKVDIMKEEGVEFVTSVNVGKDVKAAKLLKDYDRVILACGAKIRETLRHQDVMQRAFTLQWIS